MKVLLYIQSESDRQSATLSEAIGMVEAWRYISGWGELRRTSVESVCHLSQLITGRDKFREVPAVFDQGRPAVSYEVIPRLMDQWMGYASESGAIVPDAVMKEFLEIHPFADGNGRIASLLYNYLRGTLLDPEPLPHYFGDT